MPTEVYDHPASVFVASFIGSPAIYLAEAAVRDGHATVHGLDLPIPRETAARAGSTVTIGLRPEAWEVVPEHTAQSVAVHVDLVEVLGSESFVYGHPVAGDEKDRITVKLDERTKIALGDVVHVRPEVERTHFFHTESGESLRA